MTDRDPILPRVNGSQDSGIKSPSSPSADQGTDKDKSSYGSQGSPEKHNAVSKNTEKDKKPDPKPPKKFRSNRYATKKTAGQGLLGVSLITSNTAQLKSTMDNGSEAEYYLLIVILLGTSIFLQMIVGVLLMIIGARESKLDAEVGKGTKKTERLNDASTLLMFLITMLNAALGAFAINPGASRAPPTTPPTVPHLAIPPPGNTTSPMGPH